MFHTYPQKDKRARPVNLRDNDVVPKSGNIGYKIAFPSFTIRVPIVLFVKTRQIRNVKGICCVSEVRLFAWRILLRGQLLSLYYDAGNMSAWSVDWIAKFEPFSCSVPREIRKFMKKSYGHYGRSLDSRFENPLAVQHDWSHTHVYIIHTYIQGDSKRLTHFRTSVFPELYIVCEWST